MKNLIEKNLKEFDEFLLEEYGKWKVGRIEANSFIRSSFISFLEANIERLRGEKRNSVLDQEISYYQELIEDLKKCTP